MTISNFENTPSAGDQSSRKNYKNAIIWVLAAALAGLSIYTIADKNKTSNTIKEQATVIAKDIVEKSELQKSFDQSLVRIDSLHSVNSSLEGKLSDNDKEIAKAKEEIRHILNKSNASTSELKKAKSLIAELNDKITGMAAEVARLTQENQTLTQEKATLTQEKEKLTQDLSSTNAAKTELEKKVDIASTLNAYNIEITPIKIAHNGKEKITSTAKKVDKFVISFDVDNRIVQPGSTDIYVCVTGPDGKLITSEKSGSGNFTTREGESKTFTAKVPVNLETAKRTKVEFAFVPDNNFAQGTYLIQLFQNGFKIGESKRDLKKGGLFN